MAIGPKYKISPGMRLYWCGLVSSIAAFCSTFLAFCSPYWYQSWRRVHSPLANVGLWHICLSGYIKPRDPKMQSYVGCWWIHSTFFRDVTDFIMPRKLSDIDIIFVCKLCRRQIKVWYSMQLRRVLQEHSMKNAAITDDDE